MFLFYLDLRFVFPAPFSTLYVGESFLKNSLLGVTIIDVYDCFGRIEISSSPVVDSVIN